MTLPPAADVSMLTLGALLAGWDFREQFGEMWVEVPGGGPQPVPGRVLDELERENLLDLSGPVPVVTERGAYRFKKWGEKWHKRFRGRR